MIPLFYTSIQHVWIVDLICSNLFAIYLRRNLPPSRVQMMLYVCMYLFFSVCRGIQYFWCQDSLLRPPPVCGRVYGRHPLRRPEGPHTETPVLRYHHPRPKGYFPLIYRQDEGLSHPEKSVGWGRLLVYGQGYPIMVHPHSPGYSCPVLQTTDRSPLHSVNTPYLAPHISQ